MGSNVGDKPRTAATTLTDTGAYPPRPNMISYFARARSNTTSQLNRTKHRVHFRAGARDRRAGKPLCDILSVCCRSDTVALDAPCAKISHVRRPGAHRGNRRGVVVPHDRCLDCTERLGIEPRRRAGRTTALPRVFHSKVNDQIAFLTARTQRASAPFGC